MRSVGDDLRRDTARELAKLTVEERIALAFRLGDEDIALLCGTRHLSEASARELFARARAAGRVPSVVNTPRRW